MFEAQITQTALGIKKETVAFLCYEDISLKLMMIKFTSEGLHYKSLDLFIYFVLETD